MLRDVPPASEEKFVAGFALREFMQTQYGDKFTSVGSVIIITGSALYCQATTCAQYINQTWPETGTLFVERLDGALAGESPVIVSRQEGTHNPPRDCWQMWQRSWPCIVYECDNKIFW
jgi:hypothetical protein